MIVKGCMWLSRPSQGCGLPGSSRQWKGGRVGYDMSHGVSSPTGHVSPPTVVLFSSVSWTKILGFPVEESRCFVR